MDFSLRIEHGATAGPLHDIDRTLAVGTIDVAFAATGNRFPVRRVINPVPVTTIVLLLPIEGIRNRRDVLPVFSSMLSESFPALFEAFGQGAGNEEVAVHGRANFVHAEVGGDGYPIRAGH